MDVFKAVKARYSCRGYLEKQVPKKLIKDVLEAARLAPSARNTQPWKFLVIQDKGKKEAILKIQPGFNSWMKNVPVLIVVVSDTRGRFSERYHLIDLGFAVENMLLRACELGLGTCVSGGAEWDKLTKALNLEKGLKAVLVVTLGYPSGKKPLLFNIAEKTRLYKHAKKPFKEIVEFFD